jgi:argininosuccinate synthase
VSRTIFAFNGDLESRLALHWLVQERGWDVVALSINLGQEIYLEPLGELALELGASAAQVVDRRREFLTDFALPVLQAGAVYQEGCFLGSALGRYVIARELVSVAHEQGCDRVAHAAAFKGNDQVRMETALAALDPQLEVVAPVRLWGLRTLEEKLNYAHRRRLPIEEPRPQPVTIDRNLWGASAFVEGLVDPWEEPPPEVFTLTRPPEQAPDQPLAITVGFESGVPVTLDGRRLPLVDLVRELNRLGGENGVGRSDVIEDQLLGIKSRQIYEAPAPHVLRLAHRELESLVQSRELLQTKEALSRRYADLVYSGQWFGDVRRSLQGFVDKSQRYVTGEVRLRLYKGSCRVIGRRSPHSLYDGQLASQSNLDWVDGTWEPTLAALWSLPARLSARRQPTGPMEGGGWAAP